jgi:hypothetical protein
MLSLNTLFNNNMLSTYTSKNILLIIGIIFSAFLGSENQLQMFEYPVALGSMISEDNLTSQHPSYYVHLTANNAPNLNQINPDKMWEKKQITTVPTVLRRMQCRRETFIKFKFEILYSGSEVSVTYSKVTVAPSFPSFSCGPLKYGVALWGAKSLTLRSTDLYNLD